MRVLARLGDGEGTTVELDPRTLKSIAAYSEHAREYQESLRRRRPKADVRRFGALCEKDTLVLDVGCGPANDLRLLRDVGVHPVGVDLALGALKEARMLLPRHPLVKASFTSLPFKTRSFGGLWLSGSFIHLPREQWRDVFTHLLSFLDTGPVYFSCVRGTGDMQEIDDPVLGTIHRSDATEAEVETLMSSHGLGDLSVELRPDPIVGRKRAWVVALGRRV